FDLGARGPRRGRAETPLYCYRALTGEFIAEREAAIKRLPAHAEAMRRLESFDGLDRYLLSVGLDAGGAPGRTRAKAALRALMEQVFEEQTDFQLRPERLQAALARLEQADLASDSELVLVATLHGVAISSPELQLAKGLTIAQPDALRGIPEDARIDLEDDAPRGLLEPEGPSSGLLAGRVAALCATREGRAELTERTTAAVALEQAVVKGTAQLNGASCGLADEVARHLQALLRDVICGHLST